MDNEHKEHFPKHKSDWQVPRVRGWPPISTRGTNSIGQWWSHWKTGATQYPAPTVENNRGLHGSGSKDQVKSGTSVLE